MSTNGILGLVIGYALGGIPFGWLLVRWLRHADVREEGSGNIGAANVVRTSGWGLGIAVLVLDALKGWAAVMIACHMTDFSPPWAASAGLAAMLGHSFPVLLKFKGGKSVATFFGAFFAISPATLGAVTVLYLAAVAVTRMSSVGSLLAVSTYPFGLWLIEHPAPIMVLISAAASLLVVLRHRENIRRIREGTEQRLGRT